MLAGVVDFGGLLVGAGQSELGGGVQRVELQGVLEGVNRLRELLGLHIGRAEKVPGVGVVGVDPGDALEGVDGGLRVAGVFREQAEVIPGVRILRVLLERVFEGGFGLVDFLQVQVGDGFVQARDGQTWDRLSQLPGMSSVLSRKAAGSCRRSRDCSGARLERDLALTREREVPGRRATWRRGRRKFEIHFVRRFNHRALEASKAD